MYIKKIHSEIKRIFHAVWIKKIIILMCDIMKKFFYDIPHFWFKIAHYNLRWEFANINFLPWNLNRKIKYKTLSNNILFLEKVFANFIDEYKKKNIPIWINSKKIWVLWRQGIENAPDLVKICVNSLKRHNCWYEIIFLDKNNYKEYITLPDFILEKVLKKYITITHLSDIIRMALLKKTLMNMVWCYNICKL